MWAMKPSSHDWPYTKSKSPGCFQRDAQRYRLVPLRGVKVLEQLVRHHPRADDADDQKRANEGSARMAGVMRRPLLPSEQRSRSLPPPARLVAAHASRCSPGQQTSATPPLRSLQSRADLTSSGSSGGSRTYSNHQGRWARAARLAKCGPSEVHLPPRRGISSGP